MFISMFSYLYFKYIFTNYLLPLCKYIFSYLCATLPMNRSSVAGENQRFFFVFYRSFYAKRSESEPYLNIWYLMATTIKCHPTQRKKSDVDGCLFQIKGVERPNSPPPSNGKISKKQQILTGIKKFC